MVCVFYCVIYEYIYIFIFLKNRCQIFMYLQVLKELVWHMLHVIGVVMVACCMTLHDTAWCMMVMDDPDCDKCGQTFAWIMHTPHTGPSHNNTRPDKTFDPFLSVTTIPLLDMCKASLCRWYQVTAAKCRVLHISRLQWQYTVHSSWHRSHHWHVSAQLIFAGMVNQ